MPEIDGIEATHIIRSQFPSYADLPIIALTANVSGGAREMILKEGLNDFIAKPIELRDMINKIRRWLSEEKIVPISSQPPAARKVEETDTLPMIKGVDTGSALALINNKALLRNVIQQFYRSIDKKEALDEMDSLHIDDVVEKMSARRLGDDEKAYLKRRRRC